MIGFPTESYEEASGTVEFAASSALHRAYFLNATPFAGTEMAEMAKDALKGRNENIDLLGVNYFTNTVNISAMPDRDLQLVIRHAHRRFYLNPKRILRVVIHHPRILSLPWYAIMTLIKLMPRRRSYA